MRKDIWLDLLDTLTIMAYLSLGEIIEGEEYEDETTNTKN